MDNKQSSVMIPIRFFQEFEAVEVRTGKPRPAKEVIKELWICGLFINANADKVKAKVTTKYLAQQYIYYCMRKEKTLPKNIVEAITNDLQDYSIYTDFIGGRGHKGMEGFFEELEDFDDEGELLNLINYIEANPKIEASLRTIVHTNTMQDITWNYMFVGDPLDIWNRYIKAYGDKGSRAKVVTDIIYRAYDGKLTVELFRLNAAIRSLMYNKQKVTATNKPTILGRYFGYEKGEEFWQQINGTSLPGKAVDNGDKSLNNLREKFTELAGAGSKLRYYNLMNLIESWKGMGFGTYGSQGRYMYFSTKLKGGDFIKETAKLLDRKDQSIKRNEAFKKALERQRTIKFADEKEEPTDPIERLRNQSIYSEKHLIETNPDLYNEVKAQNYKSVEIEEEIYYDLNTQRSLDEFKSLVKSIFQVEPQKAYSIN